jgi:hypothetical protein
MWTDKHTAGIDKLFKELKAELSKCNNAKRMKARLDEMGWANGPPPSKLYEDSPACVVQRGLARWATIEIAKERQG